jgi:hypothetical protein
MSYFRNWRQPLENFLGSTFLVAVWVAVALLWWFL